MNAKMDQKPSVQDTIRAVMDLREAEAKLNQFVHFLDAHKVSPDREYRLLNTDMRNAASKLIVEIEGLMRKAEELASETAHALGGSRTLQQTHLGLPIGA